MTRGIALILRRFSGNTTTDAVVAAARSCSLRRQVLLRSSAAAWASYSSAFASASPSTFDSPVGSSTTTATPRFHFQPPQHFELPRNFSTTSPSSGPSNIVMVKSEEQFNNALRKVQDESLPAIFYFTAAWCGPCRLLSPIIGQLSEKYPHVTTYKVDIDEEGLRNTLSNLAINAVPTLHFFQNGKKASEVIGADVQRLKDTMAKLYE